MNIKILKIKSAKTVKQEISMQLSKLWNETPILSKNTVKNLNYLKEVNLYSFDESQLKRSGITDQQIENYRKIKSIVGGADFSNPQDKVLIAFSEAAKNTLGLDRTAIWVDKELFTREITVKDLGKPYVANIITEDYGDKVIDKDGNEINKKTIIKVEIK